MKIVAGFLMGFFFLQIGYSIHAETIGKIVAIVNDEVVTEEDLEEILQELPEGEGLQGEDLRQKALNRLIEDRLILQKAQELGIFASPEEVEETIRRIKDRFPSQEAFEEALETADLTYKAFVDRHKEQLIIRKVVASEVRSKSRVLPKEVEAYYKANPQEFQGEEAWRLSHIVIRKRTTPHEDSEAEKLVKNLLKRLRKGEDFETLAREYSEGPHKEKGGDMGFVQRRALKKEIEEAIRHLPLGGISEVISTPNGYSLFRLEDRKKMTLRSFQEVKGEIRDRLLREKIKMRYEEWVSSLKKNAYIHIKK